MENSTGHGTSLLPKRKSECKRVGEENLEIVKDFGDLSAKQSADLTPVMEIHRQKKREMLTLNLIFNNYC